MKKNILTAAALAAIMTFGGFTAFAEPNDMSMNTDTDANTSVTADVSTCTAGGCILEVNGGNMAVYTYQNNNNIMIPLRAVAEKLGFGVGWDEASQGIALDDGEVNTTIYIGSDSYYMASSAAIGMSAPEALGAAPELHNGDTTYVPAELFAVLCCDVNIDGNTVSITKPSGDLEQTTDPEQIANPFVTYDTIAEAEEALSLKPAYPSAMPSGYEVSGIDVYEGGMLQIVYTNEKSGAELTYRAAKGSEDISGDYDTYTSTRSVSVNNMTVTVREKESDGKAQISAIWISGGMTYSILSSGLDTDSVVQIIKNIK